MACRGTGRVISNLGGTQSEAACPWCEGSGTRVPGIDAQARWPPNPQAAPADGGGEAKGAEKSGPAPQAHAAGAAPEGGEQPAGAPPS